LVERPTKGEPDAQAGDGRGRRTLVALLGSDDAAFTSGQVLSVSGGLSMA